MTTKQLNLTLEEAIKFYNNSNDIGFKQLLEQNFGKDFAKPKEIYNKVYDLNTLTQYLGYNPLIYPNPSNDFEKYINACSVLAKVTEIYNEGTILDWKDSNIYKYLPYKYFGGGSFRVSVYFGYSLLDCSARLYYKSKKLTNKSYENFKEFWEDYWSAK